jgi:hypothetical protein
MTLATEQKTFDPYRLGRVAENTNKLKKFFINVTEFLQIFRQTLGFSDVFHSPTDALFINLRKH